LVKEEILIFVLHLTAMPEAPNPEGWVEIYILL